MTIQPEKPDIREPASMPAPKNTHWRTYALGLLVALAILAVTAWVRA